MSDELPTQSRIEWELKKLLHLSGAMEIQRVYSALADRFALNAEQRFRRMGGQQVENAWENRCRWARSKLVADGDMEGGPHGIWQLTGQGHLHARSMGDYRATSLTIDEVGL